MAAGGHPTASRSTLILNPLAKGAEYRQWLFVGYPTSRVLIGECERRRDRPSAAPPTRPVDVGFSWGLKTVRRRRIAPHSVVMGRDREIGESSGGKGGVSVAETDGRCAETFTEALAEALSGVQVGRDLEAQQSKLEGGSRLQPISGEMILKQKAFVQRVSNLGNQRRWREVMSTIEDARGLGVPMNIFMYNACISAMARSGRWRQALDLLDDLRAEGLRPDVYSFSSAITACGKGGQPRRALALLDEMRIEGVQPNVVTFNAALRACDGGAVPKKRPATGAGITVDAVDGESWTIVLKLMNQMRGEGVRPDVITFSTAITVCGNSGHWELALSLLEEMCQLGLDPDVGTLNSTITACGKGGAWEEALRLLRAMCRGRKVDKDADDSGEMAPPNASSFQNTIESCGQAGRWREAVGLLNSMRKQGVPPDLRCYTSAVTALGRSGEWKLAVALLDEMEAEGVMPDVVCFGAAINACGNSGEWRCAVHLLESMRRDGGRGRGSSSGSSASSSASSGSHSSSRWSGGDQQGHRYFPASGDERWGEDRSWAMPLPNTECFNAAMAACLHAQQWSEVLRILEQMEKDEEAGVDREKEGEGGARGGRAGGHGDESGVHGRRQGGGGSTVGEGRGAAGVWVSAVPDLISYNTAIAACRGDGQWRQALLLLDRLRSRGLKPDVFTYTAAMTACGDNGKHDQAQALWEGMRREGIMPNRVSFNAAIAAAGRAGLLTRALGLLREEIPAAGVAADASSYNAAMEACRKGGHWRQALDILNEMCRGQRRAWDKHHKGLPGTGVREVRVGGGEQEAASEADAPGAGFTIGQVAGSKPLGDNVQEQQPGTGTIFAGPEPELSRRSPPAVENAIHHNRRPNPDIGAAPSPKVGATRALRKEFGSDPATGLGDRAGAGVRAGAEAGAGAGARAGLFSPVRSPPAPDLVSFNTALAACSDAGEGLLALELLEEARARGLSPDATSFNSAIAACATGGMEAEATALLLQMSQEGVPPDAVSFNTAVTARRRWGGQGGPRRSENDPGGRGASEGGGRWR